MKILVIGAGAVGGYFGGRLAEAGRDVTFFVREKRVETLRNHGLIIESPSGNFSLKSPQVICSNDLNGTYDLIILSCKAYDLENALDEMAPAVGPETVILPLLNGMRHLEILDAKFGSERILGGMCAISATTNANGKIVHLLPGHVLKFGERDGFISERVERIGAIFNGVSFDASSCENILEKMWEKWVMLTTLAGATTLFRAPIGAIARAPNGKGFVLGLLNECCRIAAGEGFVIPPETAEKICARLTDENTTLTASMERDIRNNSRIEGDHIIGDLLKRGRKQKLGTANLWRLGMVYTRLRTYEISREDFNA